MRQRWYFALRVFFQIKDTLHWIHILFQQLRAGTLALKINALEYIESERIMRLK